MLKLSMSILNSPVLIKDNSDKISLTLGNELKKIGKITVLLSDEKTCFRVHMLIEAAKSFGADGSSYENFLQHLFSSVSFLSDSETNVNTLAILRMAVGPCKIVKTDVESLLNLLYKSIYKDFLPLPPKDVAPEDIEETLRGFTYNWDYMEPLMMSLHSLYVRYPSFMSWNIKDCDYIKLFKEKLQFLLRIIQATAHASKHVSTPPHPRITAPGQLTEEPSSKVLLGLSKPQSTINSVIKCFLLNPPGVNLHCNVSWPTKV
ncbi:hypothetical protein MXB_2576 [Myxobolus squamalis]|nr:hypothetical protein MXB_2576 [Myxobolus squamalis]